MSEQFVLAPAPASALTLTSGATGTFELADLAGGLMLIAAVAGQFEISQPVAQLVLSTAGSQGPPGPEGPPGPPGAGETNTAVNDNVGGVGVFKNKVGVVLHFNGINAGSNKITVTHDAANDEIDINVVEANLTLANLSGNIPLARISDVTMTAANLNALDDGVNTALHFHDSDRARANHTGTQLLATVSDVTITAANLNILDDGANTALHFHDADRARANHTGTQLLATVSDVTITAANLNILDDGVNTALHFHDSDRARANHTGTQLLATVSDVTITAANLNALDDGVNTALHFHDADRARANHTGTQLAATISDFAATVRATVLTGLSLVSSTVIAATDTVLAALGQLQAQISLRQLNLQFQDEAAGLGTSGTVDTINFSGAGVTASRAGNTVTVAVSGGGGGGFDYAATRRRIWMDT